MLCSWARHFALTLPPSTLENLDSCCKITTLVMGEHPILSERGGMGWGRVDSSDTRKSSFGDREHFACRIS